MRRIRTVIVTLSPLLAEIIGRLTEKRVPLAIVATLQTRDSLLERLRLLSPALVVLGLDPGEDDAAAATLAALLTGVRVVAFAHGARRFSLNQAGQPQRIFADASPAELVDLIAEDLNPSADRN